MARALRARAPAASLRTSHVPRATARRAAAHLAGSGAAGGWVEAEREGGGVWRRRGVEVAEGEGS